jgi:eukaryotic-like serine/threonine-protein kinase
MAVREDNTAARLTVPVRGALIEGRYRLDELIGRGGSAQVWRAEDLALARPVAVKVFEDVEDGGVQAGARRNVEARLLARLTHPHLVAVYDAGGFADNAGIGWIVMELVVGRTLRAALTDGPLPSPVVRAIGVQLAGALGYVHGRGAVHRDVKPANILLAESPGGGLDSASAVEVKLADFGIARVLDETRVTLEGATVGTANYLSPEQVTSSGLSPASDIYSLGLVLLEALTGEATYPGHGVAAALARLHRAPRIPSWLGPTWTSLLSAMTAFDPARRPTAREIVEALTERREILRVPAAAQEEQPATTPPTQPRSRRAATVAAAIGLAAAAAVVGPLALHAGTPTAGTARAVAAPPSTPKSTAPVSSPSSSPANRPTRPATGRSKDREVAVDRTSPAHRPAPTPKAAPVAAHRRQHHRARTGPAPAAPPHHHAGPPKPHHPPKGAHPAKPKKKPAPSKHPKPGPKRAPIAHVADQRTFTG